MSVIESILAIRRPRIWDRFRSLRKKSAPITVSVEDAYRLGLREGYGEGLVDGVDLGLDAGLSSGMIVAGEEFQLDA